MVSRSFVMKKTEIMIIANYADNSQITLEELCLSCHLSPDAINEFIEYDIISPINDDAEQMLFDLMQLQRVQTALRLQRDFEVNMAGVALVLDLIEERDTLRTRTEFLEKLLYGK